MSLIIDKLMLEITKQIEQDFQDKLNTSFPDLHIKYSYYQYLLIIYLNKETNQKEVAKIMNVLKSSVSKAVKVLVAKDLVIIKKNSNDVRSNILTLSKKGIEVSETYHGLISELNSEVFKGFSLEEIEEIKYIIKKIYSNINGCEYHGILKEIV